MTGTNRRELDYGQTEGGGPGVRPLWNRRSHNLTVEVDTTAARRSGTPAWRGTLSCTRSRTCGGGPDVDGRPESRPSSPGSQTGTS